MKITKRQLRRIIKEASRNLVFEAGKIVDDPGQMSSVSSKLSMIDNYDMQREDWLSKNSTNRSGRRLKKHAKQTRNGEALSAVARVYLEDFEPEVSRLKSEIDNAMRAGDNDAIEGPEGLAMQVRRLIYVKDAGLESVVGVARFSSGGILAAIGRVTASNRRILDVDRGLRQELLDIKQYLTMLNNWAEQTLRSMNVNTRRSALYR